MKNPSDTAERRQAYAELLARWDGDLHGHRCTQRDSRDGDGSLRGCVRMRGHGGPCDVRKATSHVPVPTRKRRESQHADSDPRQG